MFLHSKPGQPPESGDSLYFCGNSLGLLPRRTQTYLREELDKWATMGVEGHFRGSRPWASIDEFVTGSVSLFCCYYVKL